MSKFAQTHDEEGTIQYMSKAFIERGEVRFIPGTPIAITQRQNKLDVWGTRMVEVLTSIDFENFKEHERMNMKLRRWRDSKLLMVVRFRYEDGDEEKHMFAMKYNDEQKRWLKADENQPTFAKFKFDTRELEST